MSDIAKRFARDTGEHQMTIMRDDGLYRHLRFQKPGTSIYWFDLITIPGTLIFQGDGESYVFRRIEDMFEFFRGSTGRINPQYWAEKVTSDRNSLMRYDQDLLSYHVQEDINEALSDDESGCLVGLTAAVQSEIIEEFIGDESLDRSIVEGFEFYADPKDQYAIPRKPPDFRFHDVWDWNCRDYYWWFLWVCHAIVWAIAQYDAAVKSRRITSVAS